MLLKTCYGYVTLGLVSNLTAKIYLIYRKQGSKSKCYTIIINAFMFLGIAISCAWETKTAIEEDKNF